MVADGSAGASTGIGHRHAGRKTGGREIGICADGKVVFCFVILCFLALAILLLPALWCAPLTFQKKVHISSIEIVAVLAYSTAFV